MIRREAARLVKFFDGIRSMEKHPAAMFVVDIKRRAQRRAERAGSRFRSWPS